MTIKSDKMEIKRLKKALEEREAAGFDGFEGSGMRIATITAVARAFNNSGRRQPAPTSQGESLPSTPSNLPDHKLRLFLMEAPLPDLMEHCSMRLFWGKT